MTMRRMLAAVAVVLVAGLAWGQATRPGGRPAATRPAVVIPPGVTVQRDVAYVTGGGARQSLDLYLPAKADKPLPLIIWVHGGGWMSGSKDRAPGLALLTQEFAMASINYRLSQEARWPAQIQDCKAAVRFLRANANKYNLDPDHFGVWGASAGGHLVALLGTAGAAKELEVGENLEVSSKVQAVCDWFGPTDMYALGQEIIKVGKDKWPVANNAVGKLFGVELADTPEFKAAVDSANPIKYITRDAPPFLVMHGLSDTVVPISQSDLLAAALKKAGVDVQYEKLNGGHGGGDFVKPATAEMIAGFFAKHLK